MFVTDKVEDLITETFARLDELSGELESAPVVAQNGQHIGKTFESAQVRAVWLFYHDVIVFYQRNGGLLRTIGVSDALSAEAGVA